MQVKLDPNTPKDIIKSFVHVFFHNIVSDAKIPERFCKLQSIEYLVNFACVFFRERIIENVRECTWDTAIIYHKGVCYVGVSIQRLFAVTMLTRPRIKVYDVEPLFQHLDTGNEASALNSILVQFIGMSTKMR